jgi:hypothetical protein
MKNFLLFFLILNCSSSFSAAFIPWNKLQTGDLILLSLNCRVCQLIELEEGLPFSHMALVVKENYQIKLLEAWGVEGIRKKSIQEFWSDKNLNSENPILVLRHKTQLFKRTQASEIENYLAEFIGKKYDPYFLWHNTNDQGQPIYYCSEFIYKLYKKWLGENLRLKTKAMTFNKHYFHWEKYYKQFFMKVPAGFEGISPADFVKSSDFKIIFNDGD